MKPIEETIKIKIENLKIIAEPDDSVTAFFDWTIIFEDEEYEGDCCPTFYDVSAKRIKKDLENGAAVTLAWKEFARSIDYSPGGFR